MNCDIVSRIVRTEKGIEYSVIVNNKTVWERTVLFRGGNSTHRQFVIASREQDQVVEHEKAALTMPKPVYKPSQIMRLVKAKEIADPQPKGEGIIMCEAKRHVVRGDTESPRFWENGTYVWCSTCKAMALAHVVFRTFEISLVGERKRYPLYGKWDR